MDEFVNVDAWAFMFEPRRIDDEALQGVLPRARARAAEVTDASRGAVGEFAGVYSSVTHGMRVPGGDVLTTSGLTWVGVHPGHRRRGLLNAMIDDHFRMSLEAGECVSTLYAMETAIYGRYGYGSAAPRIRFQAGELADVAGADALPIRFERSSPSHEDFVRAVHQRMTRPGTIVEPGPTMMAALLRDWPSNLEDNERSILALVEDEAGPAAYAHFRRKMDEGGTSPSARMKVENFSAATTASGRRLLGTLRELDLIAEVTVAAVAPDDPLLTLSKDIRVLNATLLDALWLRILDLPTALTSRRYAADADLVLEVADDRLPGNAGRWRLAIADDVAEVTRTEAPADVVLTIQDLSAAYLGTEHIRRAAAAGTIAESTSGAARALNAAMRSHEEPLANLWF
jgi:predicted acetyltransferase